MIRPRAGTVFGILSLVGFALLFVSLPGASSRPAVSVWNLGHVFLFYCATQWALRSRPEIARLPASTRTLGLLAAAAVLGGTTEVLQGFVGRSSEWGDVGRDVLGAAAGLVFFSPLPVADSLRNRRRWAAGVAVGLLVALVPLGRALWDVWAALRELPTLSDFEGARELERWEGSAVLSISEEIHRSGRRSLRVDLGTQEYSGAFLTRFPGDWRDYRALRFSIYNQEPASLPLVFRLHDEEHRARGNRYEDRFNRQVPAAPGWTDVELSLDEIASAPKGRLLDLGRVASLGVFAVRLPAPRTIYLDAVRLVK